MKKIELKYEDFCKETKCVHYNLIERLNSVPKSPTLERNLGIARVHCDQACERSATQFYQWANEKNILQWTKQRS